MLKFIKSFFYRNVRVASARESDGLYVLSGNSNDATLVRAGKWVINHLGPDAFVQDADFCRARDCALEPLACASRQHSVTFDDEVIVCNAPSAPAVIYGTFDKKLRAAAALYLAVYTEPKGFAEDEEYKTAVRWVPRRVGDAVYMGKKVVARHTEDGLVFEDNKRGRIVARCPWAHGAL